MALMSVKKGSGEVYALAAVVALACMLAYGQALNGPLFFDDVPNLLDNRLVQIDGGALDDWRVAALSSGAGLFYRPVSMLSFAINHAVSGALSPFSLKATNLAIHLVIGALVYFFTLALLAAPALRIHRLAANQRPMVAVIAASIWLLHPIHVTTVLYAVQRMAQLSTLFTLAGLLVFVRYRLRWAGSGASPGEVIAAFIWLVLLGLLAVLSKENGALLPWLIAVVEVTLFRGAWNGQFRRRLARLGWCVFCVPMVVLALIFIVSPETLTGQFLSREFTLHERLLTQGRMLWQYLNWLAVPNIIDMGFFHDDIAISRSYWLPVTTWVSLLAWVLVLAASIFWLRRYPLVAFALLFYLVGHSMEASVWPLEMVFEHRNYLPAVGLSALAAVAIYRAAARYNRVRLRTLVGSILVVLVALLAVRTQVWSEELVLARYNMTNHPQSARANFFYANALFKRAQQVEALGLDAKETRALRVTSRRFFERMRSIDERDFAALVMLYQLDTLYFPGLAEKNDWLGLMETLATTRRLQSSDHTALGGLVGFAMTPPGEASRARVGALLDYFVEHNPHSMRLLGNKYRYLSAADDGRSVELLALLEAAAQNNPHSRQAASFLAQYHGSDDLASTYEAIRQWMRRDSLRHELPVMRDIFQR